MNEAAIGGLIAREVAKKVKPIEDNVIRLETEVRKLEKRCDYHELFLGIWRRAETKDAAKKYPPVTDA